MLPPVRVTLSSHIDYQAQQQQPMLRPRIDVGNTPATSSTIASNLVISGRLDVLSLSAQLQLAQGVSIFAETVGTLIKVPRREGEALLDYTKRLFEAIRTMNPAERASLERALNQLVKGITLKLLTDILNDPTGPQATRFAMRFETAQLLDRDLAAKAVVSSYRQNAAAEPQAGNSPARPAQSTSVPSNVDQGADAAVGEAVPQDGSNALEADAEAENKTDDTASTAPDRHETTGAPSDEGGAPTSRATDNTRNSSAALTGGETDAASATHIGAAPEEPVEIDATAGASVDRTPDTEPEMPDDTAETPVASHSAEQAETVDHATGGRRMESPVFYDGPALARQSQRNWDPGRSPPMVKATIPALVGWLAANYGEDAGDLLQPPSGAAETAPERQALKELDNQSLARPGNQPNAQAAEYLQRTAPQPLPEPNGGSALERTGRPPAGANGTPGGIQDVAEQLVLPMPMPHVLRDGVPLPYVAYPPEEREPDPKERKTRAISATDEDGEQQRGADGQAFHGDTHDDDPASETTEEVSGGDGDIAGSAPSSPANDLYWRMAGWA